MYVPSMVIPDLIRGWRQRFMMAKIKDAVESGCWGSPIDEDSAEWDDEVFAALPKLAALEAPLDWKSIQLLPAAKELGFVPLPPEKPSVISAPVEAIPISSKGDKGDKEGDSEQGSLKSKKASEPEIPQKRSKIIFFNKPVPRRCRSYPAGSQQTATQQDSSRQSLYTSAELSNIVMGAKAKAVRIYIESPALASG